MMFIETSLIMTSVTPFESLHNKAKAIIKEERGSWMTTGDVIDEIDYIRNRRRIIYSNVIGFNYSIIKTTHNLTLKDIYLRCFKSALNKKIKNDEEHLKNLFNYCISEMKVSENHKLDEETLDKFTSVLFPIIRDIKVEIGVFIEKFKDPNFYNTHLIIITSLSGHLRKLVKAITEKIGNASIKMDIKIISSVICYGHDKTIDILFLSCDHFFSSLKNEIIKIVKDYFNLIKHPLGIIIDIKHLEEI